MLTNVNQMRLSSRVKIQDLPKDRGTMATDFNVVYKKPASEFEKDNSTQALGNEESVE